MKRGSQSINESTLVLQVHVYFIISCFGSSPKLLVIAVSLQQVGHGIWALALLKLLPAPVSKFLVSTGIIRRLSSFFQMAPRSLTEVVNELTDNKDLRAVFSYIFGTYGTTASCSSTLGRLFFSSSY